MGLFTKHLNRDDILYYFNLLDDYRSFATDRDLVISKHLKACERCRKFAIDVGSKYRMPLRSTKEHEEEFNYLFNELCDQDNKPLDRSFWDREQENLPGCYRRDAMIHKFTPEELHGTEDELVVIERDPISASDVMDVRIALGLYPAVQDFIDHMETFHRIEGYENSVS